MSKHVVRTPWWIGSTPVVARRFERIAAHYPDLSALPANLAPLYLLPAVGAR